jgi:hypothetical protein
MRNFAKRLIICEANGSKSAKTNAPNSFNICEKLRPQLAPLMGDGGFRALLARALALAAAEVPWLRAIKVEPDGSLRGLEELPADLDLGALFEGRVVLLARLLGLMVAFIGEDLTLRLAREAWPKASLKDLELSEPTMETNEKAN